MKSDYAVKVSVRNGRILSLMEREGIATQVELAKRAGVSVARVNSIITMRQPAVGVRGEWASGVRRIAGVLRCEPEDMFTARQASLKLKKNSSEIYVDETALESLCSPDMEKQVWARREVDRLLSNLDDRTRGVISERMQGATYAEIGYDLGVTVERVRQIEHKGMRKAKGNLRSMKMA